MNKNNIDGRVIFIDYLRAIACLLVVLGHVYFMGYNGHEVITPYVPSVTQNIFGADAVTRNVFTVPSIFMGQKVGINVGALGVSIFFLISGFVILRSVERELVTQFAIRRAFRIYPVCLAAAAFVGIVTAIYCRMTGTVSPHSLYSIVVSGFVMNAYMGGLETMPVLWSLNIEIAFYVLMGALAAAGWLSSRRIIATSAGCAALAIGCERTAPHISFLTLQITFLLIGSMLYRATVRPEKGRAIACVLIGCAIFAGARYVLTLLNFPAGGADLPNGAWALLIFILAMWSGMGWQWIKPLKVIADASYPLYLMHIPFAWICMAWLASMGFGMLSTGIVTGLVVLFTAWVMHVTVEVKAQDFGRALSRRKGQSNAARVDAEAPKNPMNPV